MTLRDYVLIVARSWIVVAVTVIVGLVTAGILALTATTTYTASAQVLFTGHATTSGQDLAYVGNYVQSRMQTYKNLGTSTSLLTSVAQTIGSDDTPRELAERTDIEVSQLNTVATVSATDTTAKGAAKAANTLGAALLSAVQKIEADNAADPSARAKPSRPRPPCKGSSPAPPRSPASPSDPDIPLYLLAGLFAGLAASIGVIALREVLRRRRHPTSPPSGEDP